MPPMVLVRTVSRAFSRGRSELSFRSPDPTRVEGRLLLAAGRPGRGRLWMTRCVRDDRAGTYQYYRSDWSALGVLYHRTHVCHGRLHWTVALSASTRLENRDTDGIREDSAIVQPQYGCRLRHPAAILQPQYGCRLRHPETCQPTNIHS